MTSATFLYFGLLPCKMGTAVIGVLTESIFYLACGTLLQTEVDSSG